MPAVIVCSLFNAVTLAALVAGIVVGFVRARVAIGDALTIAPLPVRAAAPARWRPA